VRAGEGRKRQQDERELANRPTTGRERRKANAVTDPLDPRSALVQGDRKGSRQSSWCVVKRTLARGMFDGLRSAGGPSSPARRAALKSTHASWRTAHAELAQRCARAGHRSDWVLVRGSRSVEVDETCLSCRFGARACAGSEHTIARMGRFPMPAGPAQAGPPGHLEGQRGSERAQAHTGFKRTASLLVTGRDKLILATRVQCKREPTIKREPASAASMKSRGSQRWKAF
jgi:hypothetical protein